MATYYMRADGTAANKEAAIGPPSDASACMSIATHNGETFAAGDIIYLSALGGNYTAKLIPPSNGSSGNTITYDAASGESPVIDMTGQDDHCITGYGRSYLTFSNLRLTGADTNRYGIVTNIAHHITIDSCTIDNNWRGIGFTAVTDNDVYNITITNCTVHSSDETGIWWNTGDNDPGETGKAYNITISNNIIRDNGLYGIKCNSVNRAGGADHLTSALTMQNNLIYGNDRGGTALSDIDNDQGASIFSGNQVYNNGDDLGVNNGNGIWFGNCSYVTIENNVAYNNNTGNIDGIGIFLDIGATGYPSNNCIVRYNICYNHDSCNDQVPWHAADSAMNSSGIGLCCGVHDNEVYYNICHSNAVGISLGGASGVTTANNKIYNNTLVNNRLGIQIDLQNVGSTGNDIQNNIIAHNTMGVLTNYGMYIDATTVVTSGNVTIDYNAWHDNDTDFSDNSGESWSQGSNRLELDPKFKDLAADNYHLQPNSPCKDKGNKTIWAGTANIKDYAGHRITNAAGQIVTSGFKASIGAYQHQYEKNIVKPILSPVLKQGID